MALMAAPVKPRSATIGSALAVAVIGVRGERHRAADSGSGNRQHRRFRSDAGDDQAAADGADDAAEIERRETVAGDSKTEPGAVEHRRDPVERGVDGEHAREHGAPQHEGVTAEIWREQRAHGCARHGLFAEIDEAAARGHGVADLTKDAFELGPPVWMPCEVARGLGQIAHENGADSQGERAAECEESSPAEDRYEVSADRRGERPAKRHADDGQRDGEWPVLARDVLGDQRRGVRHGAAETETREEPQGGEGKEVVDEGDRGREHAKNHHAADEGDASAHAVADDAGQRSAEHHADHAARDHGSERAARHRPVTHHRRDGDAEQLVVDAVEDDRQCGEKNKEFLARAPVAAVQQLTDINRLRLMHGPLSVCHDAIALRPPARQEIRPGRA